MGMNLAELGRVLCQEFDQRKSELNTLHAEIRSKVMNDRKELAELRNTDSTNQQLARKHILEETGGLLEQYRADCKATVKSIKVDRVSQVNEMQTWLNERGKELKVWYEAGNYMLRKRTGR